MSPASLMPPVPLLAALLGALVCGGARSADFESEHRELRERLDAIEARIERLESSDEDPWLTLRRAEEIRALAAAAIADAQARTHLAAGETGGWDDGFFLASPDGNFRAEVSGQLQVRFVWNRRQRSSGPDTREGFEVRRAKLDVSGKLIRPELGYNIEVSKAARTGELVLQSFNVRYRLSDQLTFFVGRARPPLLREEEVSSTEQLAVERSLVARAFRQTRALGVMMRYRDKSVKVSTGFTDASEAGDDEDFITGGIPLPAGAKDDRWRASSRVEWLLAGQWKYLDDFTSFPGDRPTFALGAGVQYQDEDFNDVFAPDGRIFRWSADASAELGGANFFASVEGSQTDREGQPVFRLLGTVVQGGVFVVKDIELFARYEYGDGGGVVPDLSIVTMGANKYFEEHALKLTGDVGYGIRRVDDFWSSRGAGWLTDPPGQKGQLVMRIQMQMLF